MRRYIISAIIGGFLGGLLNYMGYGAGTLEFWGVFTLMFLLIINIAID